jgi:alkylhydroperoxidase family enzyme
MLTWLIHRRLRAFERAYDYDASYMHELLDIDRGAFFAFARVTKLGHFRKGVPREARFAASLVGTIAEDCGPCTQLNVTMAIREGVDPKQLAAVLRGDDAAMSDTVRLAVRFARAALAHAPEADELRDAIRAKWGPRALVSISLALTASRMYPTLKYALGHGKACQRMVVGDAPIAVARGAA